MKAEIHIKVKEGSKEKYHILHVKTIFGMIRAYYKAKRIGAHVVYFWLNK